MLSPEEKGYQGYKDLERKKWHEERHSYWKDKAVDYNAQNIDLMVQVMQWERRAKIYAICVSVGAALLLIAVFIRG